jgi:hypothetical protein
MNDPLFEGQTVDISKDMLEGAERLGEALFTNDAISKYLGIPLHEVNLHIETETELGLCILKARINTELLIREAVIQSAKDGSTPAQHTAVEFLQNIDS